MDREHAPTSAATGAPISVFARPGANAVCWVLAILLLAVYCGVRSHGGLERQHALAAFVHSLSP
jgi:hypothetical protein